MHAAGATRRDGDWRLPREEHVLVKRREQLPPPANDTLADLSCASSESIVSNPKMTPENPTKVADTSLS